MSSKTRALLGRFLPRIGGRRKSRIDRRRRFSRRLAAEMLEDRRMLAGILSVFPDSAMAGTDDLLVTLTLDANATPPLPPSQIAPSSVEIGTIQGANVTRNDLQVTAIIDIYIAQQN